MLSQEQKKLVEDNHNLIWWYMNKHHLTENDIEDWYGIFGIALCQAASKWVPGLSNGSFSMFVNERFDWIYKNYLIKRKLNVIGFDDLCASNEFCETDYCLGDNCSIMCDVKEINAFEMAEAIEDVEKAMEPFKDCNKEIIRDAVYGQYSVTEISIRRGVTKQWVSNVLNRFKKKLEKGSTR